MTNRSKQWSEDIATKLQEKSYRQNFFMALIEDESASIREAIQIISKTMGNQEFSKLIDMAPSNVSRITNLKNDIKTKTLEHILEKIGCELFAKVS